MHPFPLFMKRTVGIFRIKAETPFAVTSPALTKHVFRTNGR